MSILHPFCAVRPSGALASSIAELPYDVFTEEEARSVTSERPLSFLRIDRAETQFPEGTDPYSDQVYERARALLDGMIQDGSFTEDSEPSYYLYTLTMGTRTQTGIVGCASIDDYQNGVILKHENTLAAKELDRIRHVSSCSAHTGPIFLAYPPRAPLHEITEQIKKEPALYDFTDSGQIRHQVWKIDQASLKERIFQIFSEIPHLYIADGHHRAASAVKAGLQKRADDPGFSGTEEYNFFLSVLFPADELRIFDYNRSVSDMNGYTFSEFLDKIRGGFEVIPAAAGCERPDCKGTIGIFHKGQWYHAYVRPELYTGDPVRDLDVSILQDHILEPVLGIRNPKEDPRISFIGGIRGVKALEDSVKETDGIAFLMFPTSMDELFRVADTGKLMPPKSTWFEPKLLSGLFIHRF